MYIVTIISTLLITNSIPQAKCTSRILNVGEEIGKNLSPSRLYLPSFGNANGAKNWAKGDDSDVKKVLEKDLQVVPLAVDHHNRRNGFQYRPIISQQYSRVSVEYPRYSQSGLAKLPQDPPRSGNTRVVESAISNGQNELKPITNSLQLSPKSGSPYQPVENHPGLHPQTAASWCTRRFQSHRNRGGDRDGGEDGDEDLSFETPAKLSRQKILTVNDRESNTGRGKLRLQLTPPLPVEADDDVDDDDDYEDDEDDVDGTIPEIPRYLYGINEKLSRNYHAKSTLGSLSRFNRSKIDNRERILIDQPVNRGGGGGSGNDDSGDLKPVFESLMEHGIDYENDRNKVNGNYNYQRDYQLRNENTAHAVQAGNSIVRYSPLSLRDVGTFTCGGRPLPTIPLRAHQRCNYWEENCTSRERGRTTNPVLALTLSRHGIYLPRTREPRVYAHLALNNIHNNKPFGSYKFTRDEEKEE